jgi:hypothetical protein
MIFHDNNIVPRFLIWYKPDLCWYFYITIPSENTITPLSAAFYNNLCHICFQITAICQEAGMHAVRKNRYVILPKDFEKGYRTNVKKPDTDFDFYKWVKEVLNRMLISYWRHDQH